MQKEIKPPDITLPRLKDGRLRPVVERLRPELRTFTDDGRPRVLGFHAEEPFELPVPVAGLARSEWLEPPTS